MRLAKRLLILATVALFIATVWFKIEYTSPLRREPGPALFVIEEGESARSIARDLRRQGILRRSWPMLVAYRMFHSHASLKAGEYSLEPPFSCRDVLSALLEGRVRLHPVTIPEGLTRLEIAAHLAREYGKDEAEFLTESSRPDAISDWDADASDLEGYLFPETYHFPKGTAIRQIVAAMVEQFRLTFSEAWRKRAEDLGMTIREIVTLASLIEEETALPAERTLVSSVFHNRLRIGMKLDCDPTIVYALKREGRYSGRLRTRDLKWDSPFNTYLHGGLPPSPIANPGRSSLRAALFPKQTRHLYFVSRNDGSHQFSDTLREHQRAVYLYQKSKR
jgi:UPF0755 protein